MLVLHQHLRHLQLHSVQLLQSLFVRIARLLALVQEVLVVDIRARVCRLAAVVREQLCPQGVLLGMAGLNLLLQGVHNLLLRGHQCLHPVSAHLLLHVHALVSCQLLQQGLVLRACRLRSGRRLGGLLLHSLQICLEHLDHLAQLADAVAVGEGHGERGKVLVQGCEERRQLGEFLGEVARGVLDRLLERRVHLPGGGVAGTARRL